MDFLSRPLGRFRERLASLRSPAVPPNAARALLPAPLARGAIWLLASVLFGAWASDLSEREALSSWLRGHAPSRTAWERALASHGRRKVTAPDTLHRLYRSLPSRLDEPASVWLTRDRKWIALFESSDLDPIAFEGPGASQKPKAADLAGAWEPLGRGWPAFEALLARLAEAPPRAPAPKARARQARDPREIVY